MNTNITLNINNRGNTDRTGYAKTTRRTNKKLIPTLLLVGTLITVLFLAFQGPKETITLSEWFRNLAKTLGYTGTTLQFRSDVHLIEYFIVGLALMFFAKANNKPLWFALIAGCALGLAEETMKIFLPTREFGFADVLKDFIGVSLAYITCSCFNKLLKDTKQ